MARHRRRPGGLGRRGRGGGQRLSRAGAALPGQPQRVDPGAAVHRAQHRLHPLCLRSGRHPGARLRCVPGVDRGRTAGRGADGAQHPPVGLSAALADVQPGAGPAPVLRIQRHRHRPLCHRRRASADDGGGPRAGARPAQRKRADLGQPAAGLHPRLRRGGLARGPDHARRVARVLPQGPTDPGRHRRDAAADLLRRAHDLLRHRPHEHARVRLSPRRRQRDHPVRLRHRHRHDVVAPAALCPSVRRHQHSAQPGHQRGQPAAVASRDHGPHA